MALEPRGIEGVGFDLDRVRGKVAGRRGSLRVDSLGEEKSKRELVVVPRRAHRHRDRRAVDADLERLLDGDRVALVPGSRQPKDIDASSRVRRSPHPTQSRRVWRNTARRRGAMLVPWGGRRERPYP